MCFDQQKEDNLNKLTSAG